MADLIPRPSGRGGERGQLLLIAAFIVAVSFVALALVVNSAIFTENLATRDDVAGSEDALDHRHEVEQSIEETMIEINRNNSLDSNLEDLIKSNVDQISTQGGVQQSTQGRVVNIIFDDWIEGKKIAQDDISDFTNATTKEDWTVVEDVSRIRNYKINITSDSNIPDIGSPDDPYKMIVEGISGNDWNLTIEKESLPGNNNILVEVNPETESPERCTSEFDGSLVLDITGGTIGGEPCHALRRLTDGTLMWLGTGATPDYDIKFENGHRIEGTYSFIVDEFANEVSGNMGSTGNGPYTKVAIYGTAVRYQYYTDDIGYDTLIRVAPGEVPP